MSNLLLIAFLFKMVYGDYNFKLKYNDPLLNFKKIV